jgi:hypothetical protein
MMCRQLELDCMHPIASCCSALDAVCWGGAIMSKCDKHRLQPGAVFARVCCYLPQGKWPCIVVGHHVARMQPPDGAGMGSFTPHKTRQVKGKRLCEKDG